MKQRMLVFGMAMAAAAQQPEFRSTTRLVQVNVVVRDRGSAVSDLRKDDFVVFDGKKQRPISLFAVETSKSVIPGAMPQLPAGVFVNSMQRHAATPTNISVILFDGLNTPVNDLPYARRQLAKFLATLHPDDAVALYSMGRTVEVLHDFTSPPRNLAKMIERYRTAGDATAESAPVFQRDDGPLEQILVNLNQSMQDTDLQTRVRLTTGALEAVAQHVAPLPGRKNLIWISASFPLTFGLDDASGRQNRTRDRGVFTDVIASAARALNAANVAVYPIDARGLMVLPGPGKDTESISSPQATMNELAERTGGRAFYNTNDIAGSVRRAIEDTEVSYVLGFYPEEGDVDGRYHELRVQVPNRKGVEVRARKGYYAAEKGPFSEAAAKEVVARAAVGPLQASQVELAVHVDWPAPGEMKLELLISARELTLLQKDDRYQGGIRLSIVQLDKAKKVLDIVTDPIGLNLKKESLPEYMQTGMSMARTVAAKPGTAEVRVIVVDRASGVYGSVIVPMTDVK
jgi:VWFA-related protein